jgi:methylmalonyl-CoA mutase N-terminal domain/subunit
MEQACYDYFRRIDEMGGMVAAIERGFPQREIAQASYDYQRAVESREKIVVGVNAYNAEQSLPEILSIDTSARDAQVERLRKLRSRRDAARAASALDALEQAAGANQNLMPPILECVRAYCTVGEICNRLRTVFGVYVESSIL